ncbi:MAG: glycosyltransferase family 2 protein [Candidatus Gastranaerophilales bacterium]|nr:glycosyltransferase family 2 protein [Candidatus Gastranaerophilales bacterium]
MKSFYVVIPAFNPDENLIKLVEELCISFYPKEIIIVDDGSQSQAVFGKLVDKGVIILHHSENKGKGAALKTAFTYILAQVAPYGVLTMDADGQHLISDVLSIAQLSSKNPEAVVFGCRDFTSAGTPFRSFIGNKVASLFFKLKTHKDLLDTQTGLRAFHFSLLPDLLNLTGNGFDYEMEMCLYFCKKNIKIIEHSIQSVFIDKNRNSSFNPISDSYKVVKALFE